VTNPPAVPSLLQDINGNRPTTFAFANKDTRAVVGQEGNRPFVHYGGGSDSFMTTGPNRKDLSASRF
jgi:hypothetical protein